MFMAKLILKTKINSEKRDIFLHCRMYSFCFCSISIKRNILRREIKENICSSNEHREKELKIKKGREYLKLILNVVDINITGYYYRYNE
jgi:hypothetical protein